MGSKWGNEIGSYNGGRILEWFVSLWTGIAIPYMALMLGGHIATLSPFSNMMLLLSGRDIPKSLRNLKKEISILILFFKTVFFTLFVPLYVYPTWEILAYTALLGSLGAYIRYLLTFLNMIE